MAEDQTKCLHCPFTGTPQEVNHHKLLCKAKTDQEERKELYQTEMMQWRLKIREAILGIKRQEDALFELAKKKKNYSKSPSVGQQWSEPIDIPSERPNSETYEMRQAGVPLDLIPWRDHGGDNATTPTSTESGSPKKRVLSDVLGRKDS